MDRQTKINYFVYALEGLSSDVIPKSYEVSKNYLENLQIDIIKYIQDNFSSVGCTKEDLKKPIESVYQDRNLKLKTSIDKNIGLMKYNMEEENADIDSIVEDEISKYKTMFTSIHAGTNINYLGLVDECTQNVMSVLIRKNTSISFAKRTGEINDYIYNLINASFFKIMIALGDNFMDNVILPIEQDFLPGKSKVRTEEFF